MSIASTNHHYVFGVKNTFKENLFFLEENVILYPAGANIVVYDMEQNTQKFISIPDQKGDTISAMAVSADRTMLAVGLSSSNKPSIHVYELHSLRKRKSIYLENSNSKEFISISFSTDSRYLATQLSSPDYILGYYAWEKGKAIATIPSASAEFTGKIRQIAINSFDATEVSVIGDNLFRLFRYAEGVLRPLKVTCPMKEFICHSWIGSNTIALGTSDGAVIIVTDGNLTYRLPFENGLSVESIVPLSQAFVAGGQSGLIIIYDEIIGEGGSSSYSIRRKINFPETDVNIQTMAASSSQGEMLIELTKNQIFKISLETTDSSKKDEEVKFHLVSNEFHSGSIKGMDTCNRKPLVVTCGSDKTIRIWNYINGKCEQSKSFPEDIYCISLHPSGLYILVGFSDKLRLLNVLMDDIRSFREFPIRSCQECRFSNGGHLFAATHANMIQVFSAWTFECVAILKGHNGKVRSLYFTHDDSILVSAGSDGAVYTWNMYNFKRENEHILKTCSYSSAVSSTDGKTVYAVGIDRFLKEITESTVTKEIESATILTQVALSHSGTMMFVGTANGTIKAVKYPLSESNEFQEHEAHCGSITRLRFSFDDQYLFSSSEDGCVYVYKVSDKDEHSIKKDRLITYSDEILITKTDLDEKTVLMSELQRSLEELKLEHEYQLRLKDMTFNEKLKDITDRYSQEIEGLKISTSVLRTEKDKEDIKHQEELQNLKSKQVQEVHDIETKNNQILMEEYEKFQKIQDESIFYQKTWQSQMRAFEEATALELTETQTTAESHLLSKVVEINKLAELSVLQDRELEEIAKQNEEDIDNEIDLLTTKYDKKVKSEREEAARLKGENGIMRKKFNTLIKDIDENKIEISRMAENEKKLQTVISGFEKDILNLRKDMAERDEHIQDKERKVYDLKKRNQELEKFKFVLDFRIKELKEQVEPRETEISNMTEDIQSINIELDELSKEKQSLEEKIRKLKEALSEKKQNYLEEHKKAHNIENEIKYFRIDLQDAISYFQDPVLLKKSFENIYKKYCSQSKQFLNAHVEDAVKHENARQQEFLRVRITNLRKKAEASSNSFKTQNVQSMVENRGMIQEIVELRAISKFRPLKKMSNVNDNMNESHKFPKLKGIKSSAD